VSETLPAPELPAWTLPAVNRRVILRVRPHGVPMPEHFAFDATEVPAPGPGEFLVRNLYLSVDPAQRGWASQESNYSQPVPLGRPMRALAVAVVVTSRHEDFPSGAFLYGWFDWQDYCLCTATRVLRRIAPESAPLSAYAGPLGINGLAAYLALTKHGRPQPGESVLVSTAAGAVGSMVGQLARRFGCRTFGLTGSDEKVRRCVRRYGYDAAFNYKTADLSATLASTLPGGIDIFFDNTGGAILDVALRHMAVGGRVVQCGTAAIANWLPPPTGLRNEREVLTRRLSWNGFVVFDHLEELDAAEHALLGSLSRGELVYDEDIESGIERAPAALAELYAGGNAGKKLIRLG
jgi:NADPH-dependent curcumin reductase CurA